MRCGATHLEGAAQERLKPGLVPIDRTDPSRERPEQVRQELVLVVDVREVAFTSENVERHHHVVLTVRAESGNKRCKTKIAAKEVVVVVVVVGVSDSTHRGKEEKLWRYANGGGGDQGLGVSRVCGVSKSKTNNDIPGTWYQVYSFNSKNSIGTNINNHQQPPTTTNNNHKKQQQQQHQQQSSLSRSKTLNNTYWYDYIHQLRLHMHGQRNKSPQGHPQPVPINYS